MADISDVFDALAAVIQGVIYPNGIGQPSVITVNGQAVAARIYPGWPIPANLDADLAATSPQIVNISLYAPPGLWRNTTRYERVWYVTQQPVIWLSAAIDATRTHITLGGTVPSPFIGQNLGVLCNGKGIAYAVQPGDTLTSIAANVAALITAAITPATSAGPVISVPGAFKLVARAGSTGLAIQEVMRQRQRFQVTFWSPIAAGPVPPDAVRNAVSSPVKLAFAQLDFLALADGGSAWIEMANDYLNDDAQKPALLRRDMFLDIEYGTTKLLTATQIVVQKTTLADQTGNVIGTYFT